jgi:hypothetical protein
MFLAIAEIDFLSVMEGLSVNRCGSPFAVRMRARCVRDAIRRNLIVLYRLTFPIDRTLTRSLKAKANGAVAQAPAQIVVGGKKH